MGKPFLGFPNRVDDGVNVTPSFVGGTGSWLSTASISLENLRNPELDAVARSSDATAASTKFEIDLGATQQIQLLAIMFGNASRNITIRVRGSDVQGSYGSPVVDTGTTDVFGDFYGYGTIPYGHPSWFTLRPAAEDLVGLPLIWWTVLGSTALARYWLWEFSDTANTDGYLEVKRLFMSPGWDIPQGKAFGAQHVYNPLTEVVTTLGGNEKFDVRSDFRSATVDINGLTHANMLVWPFDAGRRLSIHKQAWWIWDRDDTIQSLRRAWLARLRILPPATYGSHLYGSTRIEVREWL